MEQTTDKANMELLAKFVTVNARHDFSDEELRQKSQQLARLISDTESEESEKKARAAEAKNKIDKLKAETKLISGHITNGYTFMDKPAELYLDYASNERVYIDKHDGTELMRETFHSSDYQKKIDFTGIDPETEAQINFNNEIGNAANEENHDAPEGLFRDVHGNLTDIPPAGDALDMVISEKVAGYVETLPPANPKKVGNGLFDKKAIVEDDNLPPE